MNNARLVRRLALAAVAGALLSVWAFPVLWALLTSFKTERDVLAYPPVWWFAPTLANYREVLFGSSSIVPNLLSSVVVSVSTTLLTMLFGITLRDHLYKKLVAQPAGVAQHRESDPADVARQIGGQRVGQQRTVVEWP